MIHSNRINKLRGVYWDSRAALRSGDKWRWIMLFAGVIGARPPQPMDDLLARAVKLMAAQKTQLVLDVGANVGQYVSSLRNAGYAGRVISFEPLPAEHNRLEELARKDSEWTVFERCAVGSTVGEVKLHISRNSYSSSVLDMLPAHLNAAPDSAYCGAVKAALITLDSVREHLNPTRAKIFLKIDTQGFELEVLRGAKEILKDVNALQLEMSLCPLYAEQPLYMELLAFLQSQGFVLWYMFPGFENKSTGQLLQFDALLVKA